MGNPDAPLATTSDWQRVLFDPTSLAVVGASDDPAKWGNWLALHALEGRHRRAVYLVNRRGGHVAGEPVYRSLRDLPTAPEMVVLATPAASFEEVVGDALAVGTKLLVGITAGFGELGVLGKGREQDLVGRVRAGGARLLGPNCMGVFDAETALLIASSPAPIGSVALVTQSGNLAIELGILLERERTGFSRLVSLGNQADIEAEEVIETLADHAATRVVLVYLEGFRDGRRFVAAARRCRDAGKPVVLIAPPASPAAVRAARSHTGSLANDDEAVAAACLAAGAIRVCSPREAIETVQVLLAPVLPRGRRLGIVADGGGHGVIAAGLAAAAGLEVPGLSKRTAAALAAALPPTANTANPIDLAGGGEQDFFSYARVVRGLLASGEVDAVLLTGYFGGYSRKSEEFGRAETAAAQAMAEACLETGRPLLVQTMHHDAASLDALRRRGIPVFAAVDGALLALARATPGTESANRVLPMPVPAAPIGDEDYWSARAFFAEAGVPVPRAGLIAEPSAVHSRAAALRYPVVVKALGFLHKSDVGGVVLGVDDAEQLAAVVDDLWGRLSPPALVVEEMVRGESGVELIVGARWDPAFGPLLLVGFGGVFTEVLADVAVALAPVEPVEAERMLRSLRGAPLLTGVRGRPALDLGTAARAIAVVSALAAAHPEVVEMEINPLLVLPEGVVALDSRVLLAAKP